ncbi:hypothetical protein AB1L30_25790 [Bremerella sp. JC817]|uniref:hypothetical protein n=1 Tax=Bremerella sp. JC817 TaxID=3231756 RepID=UPI00345AD110
MPDDLIRFKCKKCKNTIKAKPKYAGKKIACPGCEAPIRVPSPETTTEKPSEKKPKKERGNSTVILRNAPSATESQKREATKLGIQFNDSITARELSELIEWEKKNRAKRIKQAQNKLEAMLAELTPMEFMEEMLVRRKTGVLVLIDSDEFVGDVENLAQCSAKILATDDLPPGSLPALLQHALAQLHAGEEVPHTRQQYNLEDDD